jgi:hypothetical protein
MMTANELLFGLFLIAVIPSVFEELVIRGVFLSGYGGVNAVKAALINGIVFGIMHHNLRQFFYSFILGFIIALVVIRSANVLYAVIMHFTVNFTQFMLGRWAFGAAEINTPEAVEIPGLIPAVIIILLVIAALSAWGFYGVYKLFGRRCEPFEETREPRPVHIPSIIVLFAVGAYILFR